VKDPRTVFFFLDGLNSPFEITELDNLRLHFDKVIMVTFRKPDVPENDFKTETIDFREYSTAKSLTSSLRYVPVFTSEFFGCFKYIRHPQLFQRHISGFLRAIYVAARIRQLVEREAAKGQSIILYSFWLNSWATALAIAGRSFSKSRCISRAHGTDLFEERIPITGKIPFRLFQIRSLHGIYSVSRKGQNYLKQRYPSQSAKIHYSPLGTDDHGIGPFPEATRFTLVSCARVRNVKRLHLIPGILEQLDFPLTWIHLGGRNEGDPTLPLLSEEIRKLKILKPNIEVDFKGDLNHDAVVHFYRTQPVDLFISVSETEGLPVSMMEAISFGIPLLATDVGGCSEIVERSTGKLIPKNPDAKTTADAIKSFRESRWKDPNTRRSIRKFWEMNYSNKNNFNRFAGSI
jgi:glycosyltransferase involved in cell wall biosynthesis